MKTKSDTLLKHYFPFLFAKKKKVKRAKHSSSRVFLQNNKHFLLLSFFVVVFILYYTYTSFLRYDHFYTGRYDLGNMTQVVWNTAHGRFFEFTNPEGTEIVSRLAYHADFILILFAPLYWVWDSPKVLLLIQVMIVGSGAYFVYLLSELLLRRKKISLAFALAYLFNPALSWTVLFDFHAVSLATTFLLGACYFLVKKKYVWFCIFALLAALTKEQVWFTVALFGPVLFFLHKKRLFGSAVFFISLGMFYFLLWHAIPGAASTQGHFALTYFNDAGNSPTDLLMHSINSPGQTLATIGSEERVRYLTAIFQPLGFLSLLSPLWLLFTAADFVLNLLSDKAELHQIYYHYTAVITPFIFISAIYGAGYIKKYITSENVLTVYVAAYSLYSAYLYGPLPGTLRPNDEMYISQVEHAKEIAEKLKEIPIDKSVAASNELGAQLSHRERIYTLAIDIREADYVAFFTHDPDPSEDELNNELKIQMGNDKNYVVWYQKYGLLVFKKISE